MSLDYEIIFSRRRTVSLVINRDGSLVVRAPKRTGQKELADIVAKKRDWIEKHQHKMRQKRPIEKEFKDGETFMFLGERYPLRICDACAGRLEFKGLAFQLSQTPAPTARKLFAAWYAKRAAEFIFPRTRYLAELMKVKYRRISITAARTRWGSCSDQSTINFSWRLVLAPPHIIDSVIIHELAHLIHHNHSGSFWDTVKQLYPDYKKRKKMAQAKRPSFANLIIWFYNPLLQYFYFLVGGMW